MSNGTVKWFNSCKGFQFIQPDRGGEDEFVHISAVERACLGNLAEDRMISCDLQNDPRRRETLAQTLKAV